MKKFRMTTVLLSGLAVLLAAGTAGAITTKVKGELWTRWTGAIETNSVKRSDLNLFTASRFSIERGYLTLEPALIPDVLTGRFTLDFYSDSEVKGWIAGAGMKLKYAFLSWQTPVPLVDLSVIAGLQKTLFASLYDWEYVTIEKDLADLNKVVKTADVGIAIQGYIPKGFGEFSFQVANGEGYETAGTKLNLNPAYIANLRVTPIPGVMLGASMDYEYAGQHTAISAGKGETNKSLISGMVKLTYDPIEFWFQYLEKDYGRAHYASSGYLTSHYYMTMLVVNFMNLIEKDIQFVARADFVDPRVGSGTTAIRRDGYVIAIGGLNFGFAPDAAGKSQAVLQVNYEGKYSENPAGTHGTFAPIHTLLVQCKWTFGSTIPE